MRKLIAGLTIVVLVSVLAVVSTGQPAGPGRGRGGPQGGRGGLILPLMSALDADKDGTISAAEIEKSASALKKLDRNGDGNLARDELRPEFPGGRGGTGRPQQADGTTITEGTPAPKDDAEKKILAVLDDLDRNQRRGMMNVPAEDGRLLRLLAEAIGAKHVVEIGTSNGYSGIWLCLALRKTDGKLTTYEIDARRASLARKNFKRAGVDKRVTLVDGDAHKEVAKIEEPIDLLFLDADKEGYIDYLEKLLPLIRPGGLIAAHNINPRELDPKYLEAITTDPTLETLILHKQGAGVSVTLKKR